MGILKNEDTTNLNQPKNTNSSVGGFNAILDQGSEFEGKLTFQGTVRIDGTFKGEIFSKSHIVIGESGNVEGNAQIGSISISGHFNGNITAKEKVELHSTAVIEGDITTPSLVIEDGVKFNGKVNMNPGDSQAFASKPTTSKSDSSTTQPVGVSSATSR